KLAAGMTPDQAREDIARKVENEVFRRTSIWTGLTGAVPGAVFGKIMSGASKFGRLGSAAEAGLTEFGQETVQSGGERFIENTAMKRGVDPSIEPMAGVYDEAAKGGLAGMVLGGGSGALIHEQAPPVADDVMDTSAVVTEEPPPKGRLARAAETAAALNEEEAAAAAQLADDAVGQEAPAPPAPFSVDIGSVRKKLARREARKLSEKTGLPYEVVPDPQREGLFIASPAVDDERAYELALDRPQAETLARRLMEKNGVSHAVIPHPTEEGKFAVAEEGPEPLTLEEASAQAEEMTQFGYLFDVIAHPAVEGAYTLKLIDQEPIRSPEELMGERPSAAEDMTEKQLMNISDRAFENPVAAQQFRDELVKEGGFKSGELKINSWIGRDDVARYSVFPTRETRKKAKPEPEPKPKQIGIEESLGPVATPHADEINGIPVDKAVEMITGGRFGDLLQDIIRAREAGADKTALEDGLINATVDAYQQARESGDLEAQAALQAAEPLIRKVIAGETLDERDLGSFPLSERRGDDVFRKRVAEMTPEERATALLTSDKTGLPNRRAWDEGEKKPTQVSIDIDGLGPINDTYGHDAGDKLLRETGRAFLEAGVDGYHFSGDEFALQAGSDQEADEAINNVRNILKGTIIEIETPDGRRARVEGPEFSFGKGEDYATADQRLLEDKKRRTETGERAPKGTLPPWVVQGAESQDRPDVPDEGVPERQQDSEDHQAGRDRDQSREVAPSPLPVHDDTLPDRPRGVAPAADTLAKQPWEMTRDEYVHVPTEKPKTFTISIQFPSPIGAQKIRFVPTRQKKSGVSAPRVKAIAIDGRGKESQASASDIGDVAGKPFFQNETEAIPYARLLLWIEGKISTEAAATKSKEGALQQAHYRSVAEALREGKPVPAEVLADYPELRPRPADTEIAEIKPAAEKKEEKKPPDAHPYSSTQFAASDTPAPTAEPGVFPTRKKARRALKELGRTGEVVGERGAYRIEYAEEQTPTLATAEST
ncbi:MAG: diguanylate cyclase domain-containing protein, partial [Myxococcota bacterium]